MLPIAQFLPQIKNSLEISNNLVLQAEPGAGKSTALPISLLDSAWLKDKKILMLEPRRIAAKTIAHYLASQLGEKVGQQIGYQIKNDKKISQHTHLEIITEGILTKRLQNDPELLDTALIIFDEFHERSLHSDIALMLTLEIQSTIREDLKILVMSATIDTAFIADYMGGANIIKCPGRAFPVDVNYISANKTPLSQQVMSALSPVLNIENGGDTLVFLPSQAEINKCMTHAIEAFNLRADLVFLPLFGALSILQQEQALMPDPKRRRRIIFATNIAETSLTIEGVTCVIDSGLEKVLVYDPSSYMTRLETTYISKASAEQRKGRAGRTQAGSCIRLWDEAKQKTLHDFQGEEILSADLTGLILELFLWGENDFNKINWLTEPPKANFDSAISTLLSLNLINSSHQLTALGKQATGLGLSPRLAAMLLQAKDNMQQNIACELSALLSEKDIFTRNKGSDIVQRLIAIQDYKNNPRQAIKTHPINRFAVEQLISSAKLLSRTLKIGRLNSPVNLVQLQNSIGSLLLYAYPDRLAQRRSKNGGRYKLANGKGVFLYDDDPLFGSEWLVIANCDAQKKEGRIFSAAQISFDSLLNTLKDHFIVREEFSFDKKKQKVIGRSITQYNCIELESSVITKIPTDQFQRCLLHIFAEDGLTILNWTKKCEDWLTRATWLSEHLDSFPYISKQSLIEGISQWLLPYIDNINSIAELKKVNIYNLMVSVLTWEEQQFLAKEAPTHYITPSQKSVSITYQGAQGPSVSVVLQEMFGELNSPMIAAGSIALRFELLSPARRPIQTTSDLAHFWNNSYFQVIKDMKGRYPKHRWPDKPLLEKAGKSYKN